MSLTPFKLTSSSTRNGIDIRKADGESMGKPKAVTSGNHRTETVSIASIILSMSEEDDLPVFLKYWQETVDVDLDDLWSSSGPGTPARSAPYFPTSFYEKSTRRAGPFIHRSLKADALVHFKEEFEATLPADTGDFLWLVKQFLDWHIPNKSGDIDLAAGSEKETSIYHRIASFCAQPKWKHHPHLLTLKALVNVVEQGQDERQIGMNYFVFALDLLRKDFKKGGKNLKYTTPTGEKKESKLAYHTVGAQSREGVICDYDEEDVIRDDLVGDDQDNDTVEAAGGESSMAILASKAAEIPTVVVSSDGDDGSEPPASKPLRTKVTKKASGASHTKFIDVDDEEEEVARPSKKLKSKLDIKGKAKTSARLPTDSDDDAVSTSVSRPIAEATGTSKKKKGPVETGPSAASSSAAAPSKKRKKADDNSEGRGSKVARAMTYGGRKDK